MIGTEGDQKSVTGNLPESLFFFLLKLHAELNLCSTRPL